MNRKLTPEEEREARAARRKRRVEKEEELLSLLYNPDALFNHLTRGRAVTPQETTPSTDEAMDTDKEYNLGSQRPEWCKWDG